MDDRATLAFIDVNVDAVFNGGDLLILDADSSATTNGGDVRLSGLASSLAADPVLVDVQALQPDLVLALRAALTSYGSPLGGRIVAFESGGARVCVAVTGSDGVASCQATVDLARAVAGQGYRAVFHPTAPYCGAAGEGALAQVDAMDVP